MTEWRKNFSTCHTVTSSQPGHGRKQSKNPVTTRQPSIFLLSYSDSFSFPFLLPSWFAFKWPPAMLLLMPYNLLPAVFTYACAVDRQLNTPIVNTPRFTPRLQAKKPQTPSQAWRVYRLVQAAYETTAHCVFVSYYWASLPPTSGFFSRKSLVHCSLAASCHQSCWWPEGQKNTNRFSTQAQTSCTTFLLGQQN